MRRSHDNLVDIIGPRKAGLGLKITVWVPQVTCRVIFGTETVILTVVPP
jgi:hypothetical protein